MPTNKNETSAHETLSADQLTQASGGYYGYSGYSNYQSYTVQRGDNLTQIAQGANMSLNRLLRMNPQYQQNPNLIYPGQQVVTGRQPSWQMSGWQMGWGRGWNC